MRSNRTLNPGNLSAWAFVWTSVAKIKQQAWEEREGEYINVTVEYICVHVHSDRTREQASGEREEGHINKLKAD